jgi:hypothetical protein
MNPIVARNQQANMVGFGSSDAMAFHALEALQCMVERRKGGETGVKAVQLLEGESLWRAGAEGLWFRALLEAALSRSNSTQGFTVQDGRPQDLASQGDDLRRLVRNPAAYFLEYRDGIRATLLMLNGALAEYVFAARIGGAARIVSTEFLLPPTRTSPIPAAGCTRSRKCWNPARRPTRSSGRSWSAGSSRVASTRKFKATAGSRLLTSTLLITLPEPRSFARPEGAWESPAAPVAAQSQAGRPSPRTSQRFGTAGAVRTSDLTGSTRDLG